MSWWSDKEPFDERDPEWCKYCGGGDSKEECDRCCERHMRGEDDEFKNFDRGDLIALIEAQKERIGELLADRPQGEWKINNNGWAYCSKCGRLGLESYDFCPYCGARMKGANDEVD